MFSVKVVKFVRPAEPIGKLALEYKKRLGAFAQVEHKIVKVDASQHLQKTHERIEPGEFHVIVDERGTTYTSKSWSAFLQKKQDDPAVKKLVLWVGPPYGFAEDILKQCHSTIQLSSMVMTSDIAWLLLWEQLYRGFAANAGCSYHK